MQPPLIGRKPKALTAKISGRKKSYGNFLYIHIPKNAEIELEWNSGDIVQVIPRREEDSLVLKRIFRAEGYKI